MPSDETLYERLGGADAVEAVVDEFYDRVLADEELEPYFEGIDTAELREHQTEFITFVAGGEDDYDGPSMREAHAYLDITEEAFDQVAEHLAASLDTFDVPEEEHNELMAAVAGTKDDIVTA